MNRLVRATLNIITLMLAAACLFSCNSGGEASLPKADFKMTAKITAIGDRIEVDVIEAEYTSGIHWVITSEETVVADADGAYIKASELEVGDKIEIGYSGQVMMSYPPQIFAIYIKLMP